MKLNELLKEETLQSALKRLFKPDGTLTKVMGRDAAAAAELLAGKSGDDAHTLRGGSPMSDRIIKSVASSRPFSQATSDDHGDLKVVRMPGGARVLVVGDGDDTFLVTTDQHRGDLVESKEEDVHGN